MRKPHGNKKGETGNALFLILIAVALFAALSYAVTRSGSGGGDVDREEVQIKLAEVSNYFAAIDAAIQRLRLRGVAFEDLDFLSDQRFAVDGSVTPRDNDKCSDPSCEIFSPGGGGVSYRNFYEMAQYDPLPENFQSSWLAPGELSAWMVPIDGLGTSDAELLILINAVQQPYCIAYNRRFDLPDLITLNTSGRVIFHSDNTDDAPLESYDGVVTGEMSFCARRPHSSVPFYNLFHVAVVR